MAEESTWRGEDVLRRLEPSSTASPADTGVVLSAPALSAASGCSSSSTAGPPWSVGARAANEFPASAGVGPSGEGDGLRAFPRLFLVRAPERGMFFSSFPTANFIYGFLYVVPTVVTTRESGLSRGPCVEVERAVSEVWYSSRSGRRSGEVVAELKGKRRRRRGTEAP